MLQKSHTTVLSKIDPYRFQAGAWVTLKLKKGKDKQQVISLPSALFKMKINGLCCSLPIANKEAGISGGILCDFWSHRKAATILWLTGYCNWPTVFSYLFLIGIMLINLVQRVILIVFLNTINITRWEENDLKILFLWRDNIAFNLFKWRNFALVRQILEICCYRKLNLL